MGRAKEAADRIRSEISIVQVLAEYGYEIHPDGGDREQQFSCDLHGDGQDTKPSARVYPDSASFHCFACGRSRDAITLVREKEGVDFWPAVKMLEGRYGLPSLPWTAPADVPRDETLRKVSEALSGSHQTSLEVLKRVERLVDSLCRERECTPAQCAALWEAHDRVFLLREKETLPESTLKEGALRVLAHVRGVMGVGEAP